MGLLDVETPLGIGIEVLDLPLISILILCLTEEIFEDDSHRRKQ